MEDEMTEWLPTKKTAKGRLVLAALEQFGAHGYQAVGVSDLAEGSETTTGPLYHHFGSKLGLYQAVRHDVEQRIIDRMHGALDAQPAIAPALIVGLEYAHRAGLLRLLGETPPEPGEDPIAELLTKRAAEPIGAMLTAAWRQALLACADGVTLTDAREALQVVAEGVDS